jgi:hypothetical protein
VTNALLHTEKPCTICKVTKPLTAFYPRSDQPGKYMSACKDCRNAKLRAKAAAESTFVRSSTITIHPDGYALVSLHGKYGEGKFAKVDIEDVELVSGYKWSLRDGYVRSSTGSGKQRRDVYMHRLVLGIDGLPFNQLHSDHKHHDTLDNRRSELRKATPSQNSRNSHGYAGSGYKGVYTITNSPNWRASICIKRGTNHNLGTYPDKEDAARVYDGAARALFGEFAFANFEGLPTRRVSS